MTTRANYHGDTANEFLVKARAHLAGNGIASRMYYNPPLHLHPAYEWMGLEEGSLPVAEDTASRMIGLPCFPQITDSQVEQAAGTLLEFFTGQ